jgi:hypothetical protein
MSRRYLGATILALTATVVSGAALSAQTAAAPTAAMPDAGTAAALTPEQAAPFLGTWTINAESPMGPASFALALTTRDGKVVADISSDQMADTPITDITKSADGSVLLRYTFDYQGNGVDAEVTLRPPTGDTMKVSFAFAQGQFTMDGNGTRSKTTAAAAPAPAR